ncbi:hypothetical protein MOO46_06095 [Apilactobacillus apisilvae]|uniref:Uncharacterized protein n=1 Tax=Apilactobacillus apisilvae TaxID=2923364 RepID=A0ABY4PG82_9LACO|nr:hypothetical protein [Apilactobacillus apisilvae]UQS84814.1 hypothetical protein MOO46_06095 [Apilactobacillus apisilvae]
MISVKLKQYEFWYDEDEMYCFFDNDNCRIAFITPNEINLVIDFFDGILTFHPDKSVNIIEIKNNVYQIKSFY